MAAIVLRIKFPDKYVTIFNTPLDGQKIIEGNVHTFLVTMEILGER